MAITATGNPELNTAYFSGDAYDYVQVAALFAQLQIWFAPQALDGGNEDREDVSAIVGQSILQMRILRAEQFELRRPDCWQVRGELRPGAEQTVEGNFQILDGETKETATARWLAAFMAAAASVIQQLSLPFRLGALRPAPLPTQPQDVPYL
jgi:hypothetical protein